MKITNWISADFHTGDLLIEGQLSLPDGEAKGPPILLLHPHPQRGGDMHNPLLMVVAGELSALDRPLMRFNFRGTGRSDGVYDGALEFEEVLSAIDLLTERYPDSGGVSIVGYSFGGWMGLKAAVAFPGGHGTAQLVGLVWCVLGRHDRQFHHLLLKQRYAKGAREHRF